MGYTDRLNVGDDEGGIKATALIFWLKQLGNMVKYFTKTAEA